MFILITFSFQYLISYSYLYIKIKIKQHSFEYQQAILNYINLYIMFDICPTFISSIHLYFYIE